MTHAGAAGQEFFYRYISYAPEVTQILTERKILSTNASAAYETWYSPDRYEDPTVAQKELSLPSLVVPTHRIGPIPEDEMPDLDALPSAGKLVKIRRVAPAHGHPGGGFEVRTKLPVYLLGVFDYVHKVWRA